MSGLQIFFNMIIAGGVVFFAIGQWRSGRVKGNSDAISAANGTIDVLTKSLNTVKTELADSKEIQNKHHDEIIRLQEQLKHEKENSEKLLAILQDQNPETKAFMKLLTETSANAQIYMSKTSEFLAQISSDYTEIKEFMIAVKPIIDAAEKRVA